MPSLWPDSFDEEGNKTDWRYSPDLEEYYSPSTKDFMYAVPGSPSVEDQAKWIGEHGDAIRTRRGGEICAGSLWI